MPKDDPAKVDKEKKTKVTVRSDPEVEIRRH